MMMALFDLWFTFHADFFYWCSIERYHPPPLLCGNGQVLRAKAALIPRRELQI